MKLFLGCIIGLFIGSYCAVSILVAWPVTAVTQLFAHLITVTLTLTGALAGDWFDT